MELALQTVIIIDEVGQFIDNLNNRLGKMVTRCRLSPENKDTRNHILVWIVF